ncbi:MAG: SDR family oxidoreductase [Dehalococcoidales bacterium]|jgi:NAD(P)-dependent dehydrogenase (short-subunit alcohol dehydrogenase family)
MDLGFTGKVALVTGAGSQIGFGKQIALLLAKEGCAAVAVTDIIDDVKLTAEDIKKTGKKSMAVKGDVTNPADVAALIKKVVDEYGKIDILCNVAGGIASRVPYDQAKPEEWDKDIRLNLYSIMLTSQAALPYMREKKSGVIVNIGSGSTRMYAHGTGNTYAISKAGVDTFTKQLAFNEARNGVRCNCVAPGPAPTNFIPGADKKAIIDMLAKTIPMGRGATQSDIANATIFFASEMSSYITGAILHVSGGSVLD